jgi:hypothetical protein
MSSFMRIRPVGAELFRADRRTDRRDEANSCFSQFCEGAKIKEFIRKKYINLEMCCCV